MFDCDSSIKEQGLTFIDLFAGAGGLSEGFVRAGFRPVAHVEEDKAAAYSLKTREAFHRLASSGRYDVYDDYLAGRLTRELLYTAAFPTGKSNVIAASIGAENLKHIFELVDSQLNGRQADLIIGGPPCQAYSLVGRARSSMGMVGDTRNYLFVHYAEFLKRYKPKVFVFENVVGLLSAKDAFGELYLNKMLELFRQVGYQVEFRTLSANEHGVLQKRKRVILVGRQGKSKGFFPEIEKIFSTAKVKDAIGDLPAIPAGGGESGPVRLRRKSSEWLSKANLLSKDRKVTWHEARPHNQRDLEIFLKVVEHWDSYGKRLDYNELPEELKTHKNTKSFLDRFKVVAENLDAAHTVVAHISKDGNYYIHPDSGQNRSLSPREAARIQSFPDDYYFESASGRPSRTAAFKQIGNAVPVLLAQKIAEAILEDWK